MNTEASPEITVLQPLDLDTACFNGAQRRTVRLSLDCEYGAFGYQEHRMASRSIDRDLRSWHTLECVLLGICFLSLNGCSSSAAGLRALPLRANEIGNVEDVWALRDGPRLATLCVDEMRSTVRLVDRWCDQDRVHAVEYCWARPCDPNEKGGQLLWKRDAYELQSEDAVLLFRKTCDLAQALIVSGGSHELCESRMSGFCLLITGSPEPVWSNTRGSEFLGSFDFMACKIKEQEQLGIDTGILVEWEERVGGVAAQEGDLGVLMIDSYVYNLDRVFRAASAQQSSSSEPAGDDRQ